MNLYDPRPGHALSLAPGKRVTTSMSPMMALRDGKLVYALGLPGGKKIFPSAMQALINLIDHGMSCRRRSRRRGSGPRAMHSKWNWRCRKAFAPSSRRWGHRVQAVPTVAGGMNATSFTDDGPDVGCGLLARRRDADRNCRRACARGREVRSGLKRSALQSVFLRPYPYLSPRNLRTNTVRVFPHSSWLTPSLKCCR